MLSKEELKDDMIWYILLQLGSHPVAVVQYTYAHKQYTEQHKIYNTFNTKIRKSAGRAPFWEFYSGICLTTEEKAQ